MLSSVSNYRTFEHIRSAKLKSVKASLISRFKSTAQARYLNKTVAGRFTGHTDSVEFVAPSPDTSQRIVSSRHGSIRMLGASMETTRRIDFTDRSLINDDGWICGSKGELLMWIPPIHREHLHRPSNIWVAGKYETRIDLSTFVHGRSWATCIHT